jgi:hypothetical protein
MTETDLHRARVLVVGPATPATEMVAEELAAANCAIVRCTEPGRPPFPCAGLRRGACPLDVGGKVDVAVAVRTRAHPRPRLGELGAVCAVRDGIPLVIAGARVLNPFEPWAAEMVDLHSAVAAVARQLERDRSASERQLGPHRALPLDL